MNGIREYSFDVGEYLGQKRNSADIYNRSPAGWQPVPGKLWLKGYSWAADLTVDGDAVSMSSSWTIKRQGLHEFFKHR